MTGCLLTTPSPSQWCCCCHKPALVCGAGTQLAFLSNVPAWPSSQQGCGLSSPSPRAGRTGTSPSSPEVSDASVWFSEHPRPSCWEADPALLPQRTARGEAVP